MSADSGDLADFAVVGLLLDLEVLGKDIEIDTEASDLLDLAVASGIEDLLDFAAATVGTELLLDLEAAAARENALVKYTRRMIMLCLVKM